MNLLDIIVPTYNRLEAIKQWIVKLLPIIDKFDFTLTFYDSGTDDSTKKYINEFLSEKIRYRYFDSSIDVDKKTLLALKSSDAKYLWLCADTRIANVEKLFQRFDFSKIDSDVILLYKSKDLKRIRNFEYLNKDEFFADNFFRLTTYGASICKKEIIDKVDFDLMINKFGGKCFIYPCMLAYYSQSPYTVSADNYLGKLSVKMKSGWILNKSAIKIWTKYLQESLEELNGQLTPLTIQKIIKNRGKAENFFTKRSLIRLRITDNFNVKIYKEYREYLIKSLACSKFSAYIIARLPKFLCKIIANAISLMRKIIKGEEQEE